MLALTGDVEFNKDLRKRAINLGMHLNESGLWQWQEDDADADYKGHWQLIKAETEEEVLSELGVEWIPPEKRNFSFILGKKAKTSKDHSS